MQLARHVIPKQLAGGETAYYYNVPTKYRKLKCPVQNEPLGTDFALTMKRAGVLNGQFDEWDTQRKGLPISAPNNPGRVARESRRQQPKRPFETGWRFEAVHDSSF